MSYKEQLLEFLSCYPAQKRSFKRLEPDRAILPEEFAKGTIYAKLKNKGRIHEL